ncbi:MAG: hypothetical protein ACRDZM_17025, partial [Acidimicrobiia bacterium]
MTQTKTILPRTTDSERPAAPPPHPHYTLGTLVALGIVGTLAAVALGIAALMITANRNSVDDTLVAERVDTYLGTAGVSGSLGELPEDVVPTLVPKEQLPLVPADEVNVAVAPQIPPASGRTTPALVEAHFEVVEGITRIDPVNGIETETWGYRLLDGPDGLVIGTPGPVIRARVGDLLRFTI